MAIIKSPNKQYTGVSASVFFVNGEGQTDDPKLIEWFTEKGYTVIDELKEESNGEDEQSAEEIETPLSELTNDELKALLDEKGIEYKAKDTKDALIELLGKE